MTQCERVLKYMEDFGSINPMQAMKDLGVMRLGDRGEGGAGMIDWLIAKIKYHLSTDWCYDRMEKEGYATNGCCRGTAGGTRHMNYLSEMCIECK